MHYEGTAYPTELAFAAWRKSTRSGGGNNCVEVAFVPSGVGVRDSKNRLGTAFVFGTAAWGEFLDGIRDGRFDLS
ncbi:DUF397 domain-containing protein [Actinocatenispora comari]|jgi:hypothetical protein|uniref:DUF397 domain-containing protein n=1 Tax=Actinocatenispora comari TaxID=2807577 RepID=A0A8J4EN86_9ACTN|nr:DUF397 domain-containing protein [Actinocatenispora comari]GIL29543.1 DUF397 domain-containing protein [Actinocatenispora comari]